MVKQPQKAGKHKSLKMQPAIDLKLSVHRGKQKSVEKTTPNCQ